MAMPISLQRRFPRMARTSGARAASLVERCKRITALPLSRTVRPTSSPNGSFGDLSLIRVGVLLGCTCLKLARIPKNLCKGLLSSLLRLRQLSLYPRFHVRQDLCDPPSTSPGLHREPNSFPCWPKRDLQGATLAWLLEMPMPGAWIDAQSSSHTNLQSVMFSRFLDQGGELFFPSCGIDSYFHLFHICQLERDSHKSARSAYCRFK